LKERFSITNGQIQQLKAELATYEQRGMSVTDYYAKIKTLWYEHTNYDQGILCTYSKCDCKVNSTLEKRSEEERVNEFLMGLNETLYRTVKSNLLATDPLPLVNHVYSTIV